MFTRLLSVIPVVAVMSCFVLSERAVQADLSDRFNQLLGQGDLSHAESEFEALVKQHPDDQQARLALGFTQFVQAIERLAQDQYRYGLMQQYARQIPIARLPVPANPEPQQISYDDVRQMLDRFGVQLKKAEQTLASVNTQDVKLSLFLGRVQLDVDGNGEAAEAESLWRMFGTINQGLQQEQGEAFSIGMDGADVHWLLGYCHVLMAFCDLGLAYDGREWFERCGHLLYPDVKTPYDFLKPSSSAGGIDPQLIADLIAAIHLLNFPLIDQDRMRSAHSHLLGMVEQSRLSWMRGLEETDDDREWIPNPQQEGVLGLRVSREVIDNWHEVLDEIEAILKGDKLIPFWRIYGFDPFRTAEVPEQGTGINLMRIFLDPKDLDVVLFLTGTGAAPYLEEGPLSTPAAWNRMMRVFQGEFFGFAIWFN